MLNRYKIALAYQPNIKGPWNMCASLGHGRRDHYDCTAEEQGFDQQIEKVLILPVQAHRTRTRREAVLVKIKPVQQKNTKPITTKNRYFVGVNSRPLLSCNFFRRTNMNR